MKNTIKILVVTSAMMLGFAVSSFAQDCTAKAVTLNGGAATLSGKTGGCNKFKFTITEGSRVKVTLTSDDSKARFELQDGAEDETGSVFYSNQINFDKVLKFDEFSIDTKGSPGATFTLKITVTDE